MRQRLRETQHLRQEQIVAHRNTKVGSRLSMETEEDRLRSARVGAGFETTAKAIRRFGWVKSTTYCHENGLRGLTRHEAKKYAKAYDVSIDWLLTGEDTSMHRSRNSLLVVFDTLSSERQRLLVGIAETFQSDQEQDDSQSDRSPGISREVVRPGRL